MSGTPASRRIVRLFGLLFTGAMVVVVVATYFAAGSRASSEGDQAEPDGEKVYLTRCMSCHQVDGKGMANVFPPLDGSDWVTGSKDRLVRVILHGLTGPIQVNGVAFAGAMPPWGSFMTDAEVAAVSTYIRGSWSNDADPLTVEEVAAVRAATSDRKRPYTAEELATQE